MTRQGDRIDVGGHRLRTVVSGTGTPVFVCLHGLADTLEIWNKLAPALAERGQVVLLDQRGHGESDAPPGPYRREDLAADICRTLDQLAVPRAVLVGHSMGGIVAMTTALCFPDRVSALVLIGTASQCSAAVAAWYEKIAQAAATDGPAGLRRAIYGPSSTRPLTGDAQGLAHVTRCLKSLQSDPLTPKLSGIQCPVLLLVGDQDPMGPGASVIIQRQLPHAHLEIIPEHGHWLHIEAPEALLAAIDRHVLPHCPRTV